MKLADINIRDPFILMENGRYYMYGTRAKNTWERQPLQNLGFDVYVSDNLEDWSEPKEIFSYKDGFWGTTQYWAPEVHKYNGKFYMLATFKGDAYHRGTAILECDTPDGTFKEHSNGAVTPSDWECLDGTLYVEDGVPYIIFCHEWMQINDGTVCARQLSPDLREAVGEPILLWRASDAVWKHDIGNGKGCFVTDGPFIIKNDNELISIWSSFYKGEYCEAIARSSNGRLDGEWTIDERLIYERDGGHGMVFADKDGSSFFVFHAPNDTPNERPCIKKISIDALFSNNKYFI